MYDQNGKPREVVTEKAYMDIDGAVDMSVWAATGPRTLQVARDYFACATLTHFPLMGENHLGESSRGSHWETRLLREELLSYGGGSKISAFTLAMLEDTGTLRKNSVFHKFSASHVRALSHFSMTGCLTYFCCMASAQTQILQQGTTELTTRRPSRYRGDVGKAATS
eukprot:SAG31_NODE_1063_length_10105_cov_4.370778_2_plen_167_part_00